MIARLWLTPRARFCIVQCDGTMEPDEDSVTFFGNMPIFSIILHCVRQAGSTSETNDPSDPAYDISLIFIVETLQHDSFGDEYPLIPRCRHRTLLTAARTSLEQSMARDPPIRWGRIPLPRQPTQPRPQPRRRSWIGGIGPARTQRRLAVQRHVQVVPCPRPLSYPRPLLA